MDLDAIFNRLKENTKAVLATMPQKDGIVEIEHVNLSFVILGVAVGFARGLGATQEQLDQVWERARAEQPKSRILS